MWNLLQRNNYPKGNKELGGERRMRCEYCGKEIFLSYFSGKVMAREINKQCSDSFSTIPHNCDYRIASLMATSQTNNKNHSQQNKTQSPDSDVSTKSFDSVPHNVTETEDKPLAIQGNNPADTLRGCGKLLYENNEGKVICGSYMSGGVMICKNCSSNAQEESE